MKWDPEAVDEVDAATVAEWRVAPDVPDRPELHEEEPHRHHHRRDPEQVGEGPPLPAPVGKPSRVPTEGDTRHRPGDRGTEQNPRPAPANAPGVRGDPSTPEGRASEPPDDGFPTEANSCATACSALKALDRPGLASDASAPLPVPLDEEDQ